MNSRGNNISLNDHKMFSVLKNGLSDKITKTQNIVVCKDDVLYVWHAAENCILTLHMKTYELEENTDFQRLLPTEAPNVTVDRVLVNPLSTLLLLAGPKGICVLRLPRRSGALSLFQAGRPTVLCKSQMVEERLFLTQCDIYQVSWHPGSNSDAHILVLCSDNTLRLYDLAGPSPERIAVYPLGGRIMGHGGKSQINNVLGENIVAFTFSRPCVKTDKDDGKKEIQWPVLLLKGSGDVCMMDGSIYNRSSPPMVMGPLPMYPPADDNYGVESCSILHLGSSNLIVVATCNGILYHCIMLPQNSDDEKDTTKSSQSTPKHSLYVMEAIELDLGLSLSDNDPIYSCPIYLIPDEGVKNRYFCVHEAGVHIVTLPLINQLDEYFSSKDDGLDISLPTLNLASTAEYAICTRTGKSSVVNPPLGLTISYSPHTFLTILSNGDIVRKALGTEPGSEMLFTQTYQPKNKNVESELSVSLKEMQKISFDNHIRQILKHDISQPILKMAKKTELSSQECFELLTHATHIFHEEYLTKLERARKEIVRRVATLRLLKEHQMLEGEELQKGREEVQLEDQRIREKCNEIVEKQQDLNQRCSKVLLAIRSKYSVPSLAEKEMITDLKQAQKKIQNFTKQMDNIKKKISFREQQMKEWDESKSKQEIFLGKNHTEIIKTTMEKQTEQIKDIINQINHLKLDLSMI